MSPLDELEAYQKLVNFSALRNSTDILANAGPNHAVIAMSKLFDVTKDQVKMVVGSFDGKISNNISYLTSLKDCIEDRGVTFKIIFLDNPNRKSKALKYLIAKKNEGKDIVFKKASPKFATQLSKDGEPKHFSIYDLNKFRFEKDTINYSAWFSFNNITQTSELNSVFDIEYAKLPVLDL